mmetsp:Transcript_42646/g.111095  ORF Transcript_42646/g.111095 Transcript_42646/m.111095 type:complete len:227 (-) Transcript_42646:411-1091(-)
MPGHAVHPKDLVTDTDALPGVVKVVLGKQPGRRDLGQHWGAVVLGCQLPAHQLRQCRLLPGHAERDLEHPPRRVHAAILVLLLHVPRPPDGQVQDPELLGNVPGPLEPRLQPLHERRGVLVPVDLVDFHDLVADQKLAAWVLAVVLGHDAAPLDLADGYRVPVVGFHQRPAHRLGHVVVHPLRRHPELSGEVRGVDLVVQVLALRGGAVILLDARPLHVQRHEVRR